MGLGSMHNGRTECTRLSFPEKVRGPVGGKSKPNMNTKIVSPSSALHGRWKIAINSETELATSPALDSDTSKCDASRHLACHWTLGLLLWTLQQPLWEETKKTKNTSRDMWPNCLSSPQTACRPPDMWVSIFHHYPAISSSAEWPQMHDRAVCISQAGPD